MNTNGVKSTVCPRSKEKMKQNLKFRTHFLFLSLGRQANVLISSSVTCCWKNNRIYTS